MEVNNLLRFVCCNFCHILKYISDIFGHSHPGDQAQPKFMIHCVLSESITSHVAIN